MMRNVILAFFCVGVMPIHAEMIDSIEEGREKIIRFVNTAGAAELSAILDVIEKFAPQCPAIDSLTAIELSEDDIVMHSKARHWMDPNHHPRVDPPTWKTNVLVNFEGSHGWSFELTEIDAHTKREAIEKARSALLNLKQEGSLQIERFSHQPYCSYRSSAGTSGISRGQTPNPF